MHGLPNTYFAIHKASSVATEPRHIGELLTETLRSNSPLAKGYRSYKAHQEHSAEKGAAL